MTQKELIKSWILEHGYIIPAKMSGKVYKNTMFGSETTRQCRRLRATGILESYKVGKTRFVGFRLA